MEQKLKTDFDNIVKTSNFNSDEIKNRKLSLDKFLNEGLPSRKLENWKFSDISQIINKKIGDLSFYNNYSQNNEIDKKIYIQELDHNKIVIVNGRVSEINFENENLDKIKISNDNQIDNYETADNSLISLNNSLSHKTYTFKIEDNYHLKKPLIIYHISDNKLTSTNINLKLNFILKNNSCLKIIDLFREESLKNFINIFYNFDLEKDSILKNYKIDNKISNNVRYSLNKINQKENSIAENFIFSSGSEFSKNEIFCNLEGKYSSAFINGILSLSGERHHEIRSSVSHLVENTKSYQLIKSVLDEKSKSVYQGKIFVNSEAQKTDGYQLSKAILLSENAEFNAKPELEIYADDVKCSHGSASGNLNEDSIFYLMSRGLSYKSAKELLINGFLLDVVEKITDIEIKNFIKNIIGLKQ